MIAALAATFFTMASLLSGGQPVEPKRSAPHP
jgi:hypothetical protein